MSPHSILGIANNASLDEIKSAYRRLAKEFHPDRLQGSAERFIEIKTAYEVLIRGGNTVPNDKTYSIKLTLQDICTRFIFQHNGIAGAFPAGVESGTYVWKGIEIDVTVENAHGAYTRKGDDLVTSITIGQKQINRTDTVSFHGHPRYFDFLNWKLDRSIVDGATYRIYGKGLPSLKPGKDFGDLIVKVTVTPLPPTKWRKFKTYLRSKFQG